MGKFIFGMLLGASLMYGAMHYHVVRGDEGVFLVPKIANNLSDSYVDIRGFDLSDWRRHKPLAAAIMQSDRSELLSDSTLTSFREQVHGLVDGLFSSAE